MEENLSFSVLFFPQHSDAMQTDSYQMLRTVAQFADEHGFKAIWLPERHFSPVGGSYSNPAVIAASLAPLTRQIRLRAGSVVLPLHHPFDVAESWATVDQLSGGRVDIAFASGWNVNDFVLSPETFESRRSEWLDRIPVVRSAWRGDAVARPNGIGAMTPVRTYPRPVQPDLNVWLTVTRRADSFRIAGERGYNVLTMLSGITLDQLADNIRAYRQAREAAGHAPESGVVTLMLHTYLHESVELVRARVSKPLTEYLKSAAKTHFDGGAISLQNRKSDEELDRVAAYAFERYFNGGALMGDFRSASEMVHRIQQAGVNEVASMLDFGLSADEITEGLTYLKDLKCAFNH